MASRPQSIKVPFGNGYLLVSSHQSGIIEWIILEPDKGKIKSKFRHRGRFATSDESFCANPNSTPSVSFDEWESINKAANGVLPLLRFRSPVTGRFMLGF